MTLSVGIEGILNQRSHAPAVYLFTHHGGEKVPKIIKDIVLHSSSCFQKNLKPIQMDSEDFQSKHAIDDYGYTIDKYTSKVKEGSVILILNLNEV